MRWVALTAVLALAGCDAAAPATPPTSAAAVPSAAPSLSPSTPAPPVELTLAFGGDVHFTERTARLLADPATAIGPMAGELSAADLAIVNLESAVTTRGTPEPKEFHFRAPVTAYDAVKAAGIDAVSVANNHALDYGRDGLADTLAAAAERRYPVVGVGADADAAYAPYIATVRGTRVAILALSQIRELSSRWAAGPGRSGLASGLDVARSVAAVRAARAAADVVVVYVHWGREGQECPTAAQRELAAAVATAGADAIVSTHAHLLLGDGWLGRTFVSYGLGNFVWWRDHAYSNDTGVLTLTFTGRTVTRAAFTPAVISPTGQPLVAEGAEAERIRTRYAALRECTGLAGGPGRPRGG
jgi:poly-gamma-glutamate synthesis protein (capsule biosynthesis protein)